ncbi:snoaL-like polyketide cyclase family protein [Hyaloraphidium curvatum]|nr:snoaL-like polyketide cyclase family protein [Hyaloraphidium curvatum]
MDAAATRALVQKFLDARGANDPAAFGPLLAADCVWHPPPSMLPELTGREKIVAALSGGAVGKFLDVSTIKRDVKKVIVEGDTAVVLQTLTGTTHSGETYVNDYCWVYKCAGGEIVRMDEFADSFKAAKLFGIAK